MGPITETEPQCGFYRYKNWAAAGDVKWARVAIWFDDATSDPAKLRCMVDGDERDPVAIWLRCARYPVTEEAYRHHEQHGAWPGALEQKASHERAEIGGNAPPSAEHETLGAELDEEARQVEAWLAGRTIESQADADRVEAWTTHLGKLRRRAEEAHRAEKAPILEQGRAIDARWKPIADRASDLVRRLKAAVTPFLAKREAEKREAAGAAIASGQAVTRADTKAATSGTHGKRVSLRTVKTARVTDFRAAVSYLVEQENAELRELVQTIANRIAKAGANMPGVEVTEEKVAA